MILNEQQRKEFEDAARPLMKWVSENCHPHVTVHVDYSCAQLFECVNSFVTEDYVLD